MNSHESTTMNELPKLITQHYEKNEGASLLSKVTKILSGQRAAIKFQQAGAGATLQNCARSRKQWIRVPFLGCLVESRKVQRHLLRNLIWRQESCAVLFKCLDHRFEIGS